MAKSYNGWAASRDPDSIGINRQWEPIPGHRFPAGCKRGDVETVFTWLVLALDSRVEPIELYADGDEWGYYYRANRNDPDTLSCHSSGTAFDWNATRHPNGKRGTFKPAQVRTIRSILAELDGVVRWGGDFTGTPDEMHFEVCKSAADVAKVAARLRKTPTQTAPKPEDDDMPLSDADIDRIADAVHARTNADIVTVLRGKDAPNLTRLLALAQKIAVKVGVKE